MAHLPCTSPQQPLAPSEAPALDRDPIQFLPDTALVKLVAAAPLHARLALRCCSHAWRALVSTCQDTLVLSPSHPSDDDGDSSALDRLAATAAGTYPCVRTLKLKPGFLLHRRHLHQLTGSPFAANIVTLSLDAATFRAAPEPALVVAFLSSMRRLATLHVGSLHSLTHPAPTKYYPLPPSAPHPTQAPSEEALYDIPSRQVAILAAILSALPALPSLTSLSLLELIPTTHRAFPLLSTLTTLTSLTLAASPPATPLLPALLAPLAPSLERLEVHHLALPPLPPAAAAPAAIPSPPLALTRLTHLAVHSQSPHCDAPHFAPPLSHLPALASLNVPSLPSLKHLPHLKHLTNLEALRVMMEPSDMPLLAATTSLRRMVLNLDRASAAGLPQLTSLTNLQELVVGYRDADSDWLHHMGRFAGLTTLRVYQSAPGPGPAAAPTPPAAEATTAAPAAAAGTTLATAAAPAASAAPTPAPAAQHSSRRGNPRRRGAPRQQAGTKTMRPHPGPYASRPAAPAAPPAPAARPAPVRPPPPPATPHPLSSWSALKSLQVLSFFTPLPLPSTTLAALPSLHTLHTSAPPTPPPHSPERPLPLTTLHLTTPAPAAPLPFASTPGLSTLSLTNPHPAHLHALATQCPALTHLTLHFTPTAPPLPPAALAPLRALRHLESLTISDPRALPAPLEPLTPAVVCPLLESLVALTHLQLFSLNPLRAALVGTACRAALSRLGRSYVRLSFLPA